MPGPPPEFWARWEETIAIEVAQSLRPPLELGAEAGLESLAGLAVDWSMEHPEATRFLARQGLDMAKSVTGTIKDQVNTAIIEGTKLGESRDQIAARVSNIAKDLKQYQATRIAQTEVMNAYNEGNRQVWEKSGVVDRVRWDAAGDACDLCKGLHGTEIALDGGEYKSEISQQAYQRPPGHPNCLLPDTRVVAPLTIAGSKALYHGDAVELMTENGHRLAITPNHMILTPMGFVKAKSLREGDYVIGSLDGQRIAASIDPNNDNCPTPIEDIWDSLMMEKPVVLTGVPTSPHDFYGDAGRMNGNVDIVYPNRFLLDNIGNPLRCQHRNQHSLNGGYAKSPHFTGFGTSFPLVNCMAASSHGFMGGGGERKTILSRQSGHSEQIGLAAISRGDTCFEQVPADNASVYAELSRQFLLRFASLITPEQIIKIRNFHYSGHVYDLQTLEQLYIANNIVVKNCRCAEIPLLRGE